MVQRTLLSAARSPVQRQIVKTRQLSSRDLRNKTVSYADALLLDLYRYVVCGYRGTNRDLNDYCDRVFMIFDFPDCQFVSYRGRIVADINSSDNDRWSKTEIEINNIKWLYCY